MSYIQNLTARNNIKIMFQLPSQDNGKRNVFLGVYNKQIKLKKIKLHTNEV